MQYSLLFPFLSGLSTLLGLIPIYLKIKDKDKLIYYSELFSSGIMISISIFDLLKESFNYLNNISIYIKLIIIISSFSLGYLISNILNNNLNINNKLYKLGLLSFIIMFIHNLPEGILSYIITNNNIKLGLPLTIAIAIHNIPEGISISILYIILLNLIKKLLYMYSYLL